MLPRILTQEKQNRPPGSFRAAGNFALLDIAAAAQENEFISIMGQRDNGSGARLPESRKKEKAFIYIMSGNPCQAKQFNQRGEIRRGTEPAEICQVIYFHAAANHNA